MFTILIMVMVAQVNAYIITFKLYILLYVNYTSVIKKKTLSFIISCIVVEVRPSGSTKRNEFGLTFRLHNLNSHLIKLWERGNKKKFTEVCTLTHIHTHSSILPFSVFPYNNFMWEYFTGSFNFEISYSRILK